MIFEILVLCVILFVALLYNQINKLSKKVDELDHNIESLYEIIGGIVITLEKEDD